MAGTGAGRVFSRDPRGWEKRDSGAQAFDIPLGIYGSCTRMSAQDFAVLCYHFNVCEVPGGDWS
eukprot:7674031-Pyramimonas_sp.AAC.1